MYDIKKYPDKFKNEGVHSPASLIVAQVTLFVFFAIFSFAIMFGYDWKTFNYKVALFELVKYAQLFIFPVLIFKKTTKEKHGMFIASLSLAVLFLIIYLAFLK